MNYNETYDVIKRYLLARIPIITISSIEKQRVINLLNKLSDELNTQICSYSMANGICDLKTNSVIAEEKNIMGALDFIANEIKTKGNTTYVLTDILDIDKQTTVSRYLLDIVNQAEKRGSTIIIITTDNIWLPLQRLGMSVKLNLPTNEEMYDIINKNLEPYRNQIEIEWDETDLKDASITLSGISEIEAKNVIASLIAKGKVTKEDIKELKYAKDKLFNDIAGLEKIDIKEDFSFGGLKGLKKWLDEKGKLLDPNKKEEMKNRGIHPPRGILLIGVPGCGKSLSAKAIANRWQLPLYRLDLATVQGMYVGQSEHQLKEALEASEYVSPCILWIDEIEKGLSSKNEMGVTTRMIGQFLFWLQECKKPVFVIATANNVSELPAELLRKGRFDEMFFIDLPNKEERKEIITLYVNKYLKVNLNETFLMKLVDICEGFSSSDIEVSIRDIAYKLVAEPNTPITENLIIDSLNRVVSLSKSNPEKIEAIRQFGKDRAISATE